MEPSVLKRLSFMNLVATKYPTIIGISVISAPYTKRISPCSLRISMKPAPASTPAPIRNSARPNSLRHSSTDFSTWKLILPACPKCPRIRPAISGPPDVPSENCAPPGSGITIFARMMPSAMASENANRPIGSTWNSLSFFWISPTF